jgi:hypothetical protein
MMTRNSKKRKVLPETTEVSPPTKDLDCDDDPEYDDDSEFEDEEVDDDDDDDDDDEDDDEDEEYEDDFEEDENDAAEMLKRLNPLWHERFLRAQAVMKSREISVEDILSCEISDEKRATLLEKFECLKNIEQPTEEYIELRDRLRLLYYKYVTEMPSPFLSPQKPNQNVSFETISLKKMSDAETELSTFKGKIVGLKCSSSNRKVFEEKLEEFEENTKGDEKSKIKRWMNTALTLPFDKLSVCTKSEFPISSVISKTREFLDKKLYGMKNVKERLMLFLNKKLREGNSRGCNIALVGKPGVGKTAISKALSECLNLPFAQLSFGGVTNSEFLMGHDYTYVGSRPGEITRCLIRMGAKNGILFFDEFDKASDKKDIMSTLLHITDFSQNNEFRDNYFPELTQDLSRIWFIYSMNELPTDPAMLDRLEVICVDEYTSDERRLIASDYLFPKYMNELSILKNIVLTDDGVKKIVDLSANHLHKKGVRDLERAINLIIEKIYFFICNRDVDYDYPWYKKIKDSIDRENRVMITGALVEKILEDSKKTEHVYTNMYM